MSVRLGALSLLIWISLLSVLHISAQREPIFKKYAGTYVTGHEFGGGSIKLEDDGTFSDGGGSDDGTQISTSGKYALSNGFLIFSIMKKSGSRGGDPKEFNLLDPKELTEWSYGHDAGEIEKEFRLLPIEWSKRIYLIYEKDLKDFVNAINLGIEPRPWLTSDHVVSPWFGSFYLREGDQTKRVLGKPNVPKEWIPFLLNRPMTATVISVQSVRKEKYGTVSTVTINRGSKDGLKIGIRLVAKKETPSLSDGSEVISVGHRRAQIEATLNFALKVGERLSTRYEPPEMLKRMRMLQETHDLK